MSPADEAHRAQMHIYLGEAAEHFATTVVGEPVFGWRDRTIGAATADGRWLRVVWAPVEWGEGEWWTGSAEAAAIADVPKPDLVGTHEWTATDEWGAYRLRAEVAALVADTPSADTQDLTSELDLPDEWWASLRAGLDRLAVHPTERGSRDQDHLTDTLLACFGGGFDTTVSQWGTAHRNLTWANVTAPNVTILGWDNWGVDVAGYDAATLLVLSLLAPATAHRVHDSFADLLDTQDGRLAQLYAIARYLRPGELSEFRRLAVAMHEHARTLIARMR